MRADPRAWPTSAGRARRRSRGRSHRARAARAARCAPLRWPATSCPSAPRSNRAPQSISSRTNRGPSSTSARTARSSHRPSPAASVSAAWSSGESPGPDRRGDAALRVAGVAFAGLRLGEDQHLAGRTELRDRAQARDATSDDEVVCAEVHGVSDPVILDRAVTGARPQPTLTCQTAMYAVYAVTVEVRTASARYPIEIGAGAAAALPALLDAVNAPARRFVVSTAHVWELHGGVDQRRQPARNRSSCPTASATRTSPTVMRIYDALIKASARSRELPRSRSAAASSATSPDSRRPPTCAASRSCRCRPRCWRRLTARSAARPASIIRSART